MQTPSYQLPVTSYQNPATNYELPAASHDLIIIGGGINGAGIARDAAMRGLKVLLLEKNDFAYGTSSRSTKLIHGGIRYLENFDFKLVWEACHERKILTEIAPQLVHPMPFIIPVYRGDKRPLWFIRLGMAVYDLMAGLKNLAPHRHLSAQQLLKIAPSLQRENLSGGGLYYDAQTDDARLVLANIQDAVRHGAEVKNYCEVTQIQIGRHDSLPEKGKDYFQVEAKDVLTGAKTVFTAPYLVNATGPWLDQNLKKWKIDQPLQQTRSQSQADPQLRLRLTKGVHFFIPKLLNQYAILVPATDGRVFFVIPWGENSLVGTTDTDYQGNPDEVKATQDDQSYLLKELNRLFPEKKIKLEIISSDFAGLRPLVSSEAKAGKISREYRLEENNFGNATLLSVVGGKITTYRHLGQIVTDKIIKKLQGTSKDSRQKCLTVMRKLPGSEFPNADFELFKKTKIESDLRLQKFPPKVAEHLLMTYGSEIDVAMPYLSANSSGQKSNMAVSASAGFSADQQIIPESPVLWGELAYAVKHEFVKTAIDFIRRRSDLYLYLKKYPDLEERVEAKLQLFLAK